MDNKVVECEVNYADNSKVQDCQVVRVKYDEVAFDIKRDNLVALLLAIGSVTDVEKLIPMKMSNVKKIERLLTFQWEASRNYQKGERVTIKAPWIDEVPTEQEVMAGNVHGRNGKRLDTIHKNSFMVK